MNPMLLGAWLLGIFFALILLNVPITISLGASALIVMFAFDLTPDIYADIMYTGISKYALIAIPFFVLSGVVMEKTGISKRIVDFVNLLLGPLPGGLAIVSLVVTTFWGAISGSGPATVAALGVVLIPAMIDAGYDKGFAAAIIAAAGGISIVIPPSVTFILYGTLTGASVGSLFAAGFLPGLVIMGCFLIYIVLYSIKNNYRGTTKRGTGKEIWEAFKDAFWGLMTPVVILGGIYGGIFTPTEAAIISVIYALIIGAFVYKSFNIHDFFDLLVDSGVTSGSVLVILANAAVFAWFMTSYGVASAFSKAILAVSSNNIVVLLLMLLIVIIAGFFLDGNSIFYILTPLFVPIIKEMNMSLIWLGVVMSMGVSVGLTTPPVAANLYPAARIANISLAKISKGIIGFVIAGTIAAIIVLLVPEIALVMPRVMGMNIN